MGVMGDPSEILEEVAAEVKIFLIDLEAVWSAPGPVGDHLDVGGFDALVHLIGTGNFDIDEDGRFLARYEAYVAAGDSRAGQPNVLFVVPQADTGADLLDDLQEPLGDSQSFSGRPGKPVALVGWLVLLLILLNPQGHTVKDGGGTPA